MRVFVIFFVVALANINVWVVFRGNGHKPRWRTRSFIGCEVRYDTILLAQILLFNNFFKIVIDISNVVVFFQFGMVTLPDTPIPAA
jgi:hypothetical protein